MRWSATALPTSHGFGMTKQPEACSPRKTSTRSLCVLTGQRMAERCRPTPAHRPFDEFAASIAATFALELG
jgi:hypothetical protein